MKRFDTEVQYLKYKVLREVAISSFEGTMLESYTNILKKIVPGPKPTTRCCVYKERAIVAERINLALGGNKNNPNVIEVIDIACDECSLSGFLVTEACRGCIAHSCKSACKKDAIYFDRNQKAHIDKEKCIDCGMCANVCPYNAIQNFKRPCEIACKVKAISMNENKTAKIDNDKCIACGACVYQCPFGAIMDKSYITDVIKLIRENKKVYAIVAPSISSNFTYLKLGQVITAMKMIGFYDVVEVAIGADMVALEEAKELKEKGFLTSSCCPSFTSYIKKYHPNLIKNISHSLSPMAVLSKHIKEQDEDAYVVFIGPCTSKKLEAQDKDVNSYVDYVLTFEELEALLHSKKYNLKELEETNISNASYYGRIFARSGGLTEAVKEALFEQNIDFSFNPILCDGIEECKKILTKVEKNLIDINFIEGMACKGGCVSGPCALTHGNKNKEDIDNYGKLSSKKIIMGAYD